MTDEERIRHLEELRRKNKPSGLTPVTPSKMPLPVRAGKTGVETEPMEGRINPALDIGTGAGAMLDSLSLNVQHLLQVRIERERLFADRAERGVVLLVVMLVAGAAGLLGVVVGAVVVFLAT